MSLCPRTRIGHHLPLPMGEVPKAERACFTLSVGSAASSPRVGAKGENGLPHQCEHWFAMTFFFRELVQERHRAVPYGISDTDQPGTHRLRRPAARLLTNLSNFVFNSVICCSKPPSILKTRKVAEAVSRLLSNSVESSFLPLFFPNPKRKPPMARPSGVFPHLLPNYVVPP